MNATTKVARATASVSQRMLYSAAGSCAAKNFGIWLSTLADAPVNRNRALLSDSDNLSP